jgi:catechol 2,3-dioxygenase-like lactoylglutathione lyase family enzyme
LGQLHYLSSFAEIGVADLDASVRWYEDVLGFRRIATYGEAVHLRRGEGQDLLLRQGRSATWNLATDVDLAELSAAARQAGVEDGHAEDAGPDRPESLSVRDPDGNLLRFFKRQRPGPQR